MCYLIFAKIRGKLHSYHNKELCSVQFYAKIGSLGTVCGDILQVLLTNALALSV